MIHSILSQCKKSLCLATQNGVATFYLIKWGAWALIALYLSIASGVIIGLQYDYSTPYYSSSALDILIPYGYYFRSLHFYTSQFFFFFTCFHLVSIYAKTEKYKQFEWLKLVSTIPIILLLLFTGYILRGDSTGSSAGNIAESIVHVIPFLGSVIDSILLSLDNSGLRKVYIQHVAGLDIILFILLWTHLRVYRIKITDYLPVSAAMLLFSVAIYAPMDPEKLGTTYISGPWFFLGLQELLRYISPLIAGVLIPMFVVVLLLSIQPCHPRHMSNIRILFLFLLLYTGLSSVAFFR